MWHPLRLECHLRAALKIHKNQVRLHFRYFCNCFTSVCSLAADFQIWRIANIVLSALRINWWSSAIKIFAIKASAILNHQNSECSENAQCLGSAWNTGKRQSLWDRTRFQSLAVQFCIAPGYGDSAGYIETSRAVHRSIAALTLKSFERGSVR
jgi:hypothetical protein